MVDAGSTKKSKSTKANSKKNQQAKKKDPYIVMNREADTFFGGGSWPLPADELIDKK